MRACSCDAFIASTLAYGCSKSGRVGAAGTFFGEPRVPVRGDVARFVGDNAAALVERGDAMLLLIVTARRGLSDRVWWVAAGCGRRMALWFVVGRDGACRLCEEPGAVGMLLRGHAHATKS